MFRGFFDIFLSPQPEISALCVLPAPPAARPKAPPPPPKQPGVFVIDDETRTFGFRHDKEADRLGAVPHLTDEDCAELKSRDLWGKKKVITQNQTAKRHWHDGHTVGETAHAMGLSESWVEKRFAVFGATLPK